MKRSASSSIRNDSSKSMKLDHLQQYFSQPRAFANLQIQIDEHILWCDKALLAAASPVLREQLLKLNPSDQTLIFHDLHLEEFLLMLEFIYPIFNPEINEENISALIELSYRFEFDVLKYACQSYVMKYLSQIRRIFVHRQTEGGDRDVNDLIEFTNQTCYDALDIIMKLCRWLKVFYSDPNRLPRQAIFLVMSILQQISIDYLEKAMIHVRLTDEMKVFLYKERAHYLERMASVQH